MQLPYSEELNTGYLARLFDNTSECYKLFWFKSIISKVHEGKTELFYGELIDKMIADAIRPNGIGYMSFKYGDFEGDLLSLQREDNKFDSNAILILNDEGKKLGYVPEKDNIIFARLMDAGKLLKAKISNITQKGSFTQISVGIYLVDL